MHTQLGGDRGVGGAARRPRARSGRGARRDARRATTAPGAQHGSSRTVKVMMNGLVMAMDPLSSAPGLTADPTRRGYPHAPEGWARWHADDPRLDQGLLRQRLIDRARERWPQLSEIRLRYRAGFAYVDGVLADGEQLRLCRLRYAGSARDWGFAIYRASHDDYEDSFLPTGSWAAHPKTPSTPPAASTSATPPPGPEPPTNLRPRPLVCRAVN